jgi:hypothetical protein
LPQIAKDVSFYGAAYCHSRVSSSREIKIVESMCILGILTVNDECMLPSDECSSTAKAQQEPMQGLEILEEAGVLSKTP